MNKYPGTTFAGAVTDNTSVNKSAWQILKRNHPSMFFHGCVSHGCQLMVKDIFAATKTKKGGQPEPTYPKGYPFEGMLQLAIDCKDLVKFFGDGLPADDRRQLEDLLFFIPEDEQVASTEERKMLLCDQLTQYVIAARREKTA
jgi:hypothetical protein